ncbi:uncharacterized protein LOC131034087 [Cryptomeria japonica]|uniref:uncharacterized protein LOC131034087 n=1 Tax=Cryptomeria japonica TaxID=3369 RepID=UPI0025AD9527|nr:uncharacterized protein LOC131034087 [Cryptomeria japonica]
MVVANKKFAIKIQHETKPLLEMLKNKDSWDEVKKVMEEIVVEKNEPKTIANFEDIPEDFEFRKLWNIENPSKAYDGSDEFDDDRDTDSDNEIASGHTTTTTANCAKTSILSETVKQTYTLGAAIIEKMGYQGGGLGSKGKGPWTPLEVKPRKTTNHRGIGVASIGKGNTYKPKPHFARASILDTRIQSQPEHGGESGATSTGGDGMGTSTSCGQ